MNFCGRCLLVYHSNSAGYPQSATANPETVNAEKPALRHVKIFATGAEHPQGVSVRGTLTAEQMVSWVKELTGDRRHDMVSIGYPGFKIINEATM
jgi:hypothetical protein